MIFLFHSTKKTIDDGMCDKLLGNLHLPFVFANGISLRVETRIALLDEEHLINETVIFLECRIGFP